MGIRQIIGDCRQILKTLPSESVHCVVTSPPYWGLRDYGTAKWEGGDSRCDHTAPNGQGVSGQRADRAFTANAPYRVICGKCGASRIDSQIGLEPTFDAFIGEMVAVFREVRRVLRSDGTLWLNLGDSYAGSWGAQGRNGKMSDRSIISARQIAAHPKNQSHTGSIDPDSGLKPKDLCGIPWRVAFALQADGWWLRQDIIWAKPNPMPESVTDRCTKAHEYIFLLSKSARYWYDAEAIKEPHWHQRPENQEKYAAQIAQHNRRPATLAGNGQSSSRKSEYGYQNNRFSENESGRNKRSVWEVATAPFSEAHFATFPPELIEPAIKAGCPDKCCPKCGAGWERQVLKSGGTTGKSWHDHKNDLTKGQQKNVSGMDTYRVETLGFQPTCSCPVHQSVPGTVLDPFGGAGTTGLVADRLQRNAILIELNPTYANMSQRRIENDAPLFANVSV